MWQYRTRRTHLLQPVIRKPLMQRRARQDAHRVAVLVVVDVPYGGGQCGFGERSGTCPPYPPPRPLPPSAAGSGLASAGPGTGTSGSNSWAIVPPPLPKSRAPPSCGAVGFNREKKSSSTTA